MKWNMFFCFHELIRHTLYLTDFTHLLMGAVGLDVVEGLLHKEGMPLASRGLGAAV
jgi:hypothetical protein